jgi:hypothetical protein
MKTAFAGVVLVAWALTGATTLRRHNRERREIVDQLEGLDVLLEARVGRGAFTHTKRGVLSLGTSRWTVVLRGGGIVIEEVPLSAIRSITDVATGTRFGPWR